MEFFADWHTHSTYSDGRGTIEENVAAAVAMGLEQVAITDHGPGSMFAGVKDSGTYRRIQEEIDSLNIKYENIEIKAGAEAAIISPDGGIDIPGGVTDWLDILIVGMHPFVWPESPAGYWSVVGINLAARVSRSALAKARINNTKALKEAVCRFDIDFVSHPDLKMPVDIAELAGACVANDSALEINTGHHYDKEDLVRIAAKAGVDLVVASDAHFPETVGKLETGAALLEKYRVPVENILNARHSGC